MTACTVSLLVILNKLCIIIVYAVVSNFSNIDLIVLSLSVTSVTSMDINTLNFFGGKNDNESPCGKTGQST